MYQVIEKDWKLFRKLLPLEAVPQAAARLAGSVYGAARKGIYRIAQQRQAGV